MIPIERSPSSRRHSWREAATGPATIVVALALLLVACGGSPSSAAPTQPASTSGSDGGSAGTPAATDGTGRGAGAGSAESSAAVPNPEPEPATAWDAAMRGIGRDGTVPLGVALQAYALTIGPLPGVDEPAGAEGGPDSATEPLRWILRHWDALTAEQQMTVERQLDIEVRGDPASATGEIVLASALRQPQDAEPTGNAEVLGDFQAAADLAEQRISTLLGRTLSGPIVVRFATLELEGKRILALTSGVNAEGEVDWGYMDHCDLVITQQGQQQSNIELQALMYHEVFHCFDWDLTTLSDALLVAPWLSEGSAAWVGEALLPPEQRSMMGFEYGHPWFRDAGRPLFQRGYDAIGFYSHMAETGLDPWSVFDRMLLMGRVDSAAAYDVVARSTRGDAVIDSWGPGYFRDQSQKPVWDSRGPGLSEEAMPSIASMGATNGTSANLTVAPLAVAAVNLELGAEVVVLKAAAGRGMIRFSDGKEQKLSSVLGVPLCTKPGGCTCPSGSPGAAHAFQRVAGGPARVGITAHTAGVELEVLGYAANDACEKEPKDFKPPADDCLCPHSVIPVGRRRATLTGRARARHRLNDRRRRITRR